MRVKECVCVCLCVKGKPRKLIGITPCHSGGSHLQCTVHIQDTHTNLSLCVHNGHCICPVTYDELVVDFRQDVHAINSDVILS